MSPENLKTRSEYGRNYQSDYNLLKKSEYFDEKYYRQQFSSDEDIGDPIAHFLLSDRYMSTCKNFNPKWYNDNYRDVSSSDINPLVHFLRYGQDEHRLYRYARLSHESFKNMDTCATIEEYYNTIYDSDVFDIEYYLSNNDVDLEGLDPIIHYILIGANKGYNPSKTFSTYDFVDSDNLDKVTTNPLYHFIKYGYSKKVEPFTDKFHYVNNFETFYTKGILEDIQLHLEQKISIIIPIYNAYEETKACITSVLRNTYINYELILINDCSTDERISQLLSQVDRIPFVKVVENEHNQGFVKNVNLGMNMAENDVVLLNSDTIVTPKWLSKLIISAYSDSTIATVTPFCNSSDISIPELGTINDQLFLNKNAYQVDKLFNNEYLESPTGNGFCLYIKRGAIRKLGVFDEVFGMGYGEETDFTCRAKEAGWKNIRNNDVFVYHRRHASFSDEKSSEYKKKNKSIIQQRHGYVYDAWDDFVASSKVKEAIDTIRDNLVEYKNSEKILYVTEMYNDVPVVDDAFYDIASKYDTYILTINSANIRLFIYDGIDTFLKIRQLPVVDIDDNNYFESFYYNMLLILKIDLLYVRNFYNFFTPKRTNLSVFVNFTHYMEIPMIYDGAIYQDRNIMDVIEEKLNPLDSLEECISDNESYFDFTNKKIAVYTAISGDYDEIVTPTHIEEDFDYICFTDNPNLVSDFWDIRPMEELDLDEIRKARRYKVLPHKYLDEYDYSIWIDGNFDITGSLKDYIHEYSRNHKLLAIKHEDRDCIYDEMEACLELEKDTRETMESQINKYKSEGYPEHNGLVASGILFRDHHDRDVIKVMEDWYQEIVNHSYRDQLSFNYVCWKNNFSYDESLIFYPKNEYFKRLGHSNFRVFLKTSNSAIEVIKDKLLEPTSIIIPIYNAYEETRDCIESVIKYTNIPYELILINDCSPDKRIGELLSEYDKLDNVRVINNKTNQGFVKNINIGFRSTEHDVLILNSDTIVTPKWLSKIKTTAYLWGNIATVTPLSNNAGAFSVPLINEENEINPELGLNGTANIVEKISIHNMFDLPTGNGFCMYIKRGAIRDVGEFDLNFGMGYGEENDFCMRAVTTGWVNVFDTSTYIYHNRSVSFGEEKQKLIEAHSEYLNNKHPSYKPLVDKFVRSKKYEEIRDRIGLKLNSQNPQRYNKKRILYVIHEGKGGTLYTSVDLMQQIVKDMEVYILTAGRKTINLYEFTNTKHQTGDDDEFMEQFNLIESWNIKSHYTVREPHNKEFNVIYFHVLRNLHIDIVHIRHLIRHSFDLPYLAKAMGIPVILSFHDFYYVCVAHNLLDNNGVYCGGHCSPLIDDDSITGQCKITMGLDAPLMKEFIDQWRENVSDMMKNVLAFVTTSPTARDIYTDIYPELNDAHFEIIEHGRDLETPSSVDGILPEFKDDEKIRIVFPGNINLLKGALFIRDIKKYDVDDKLEIHFLGVVPKELHLDKVGIDHGPYNRSEFNDLVRDINPHFIGLLSIWPETYCHTLTESWAYGLPVISLDMGALGERIKTNGGGFLISDDPEQAYHDIINIYNDRDEYYRVAHQIPDIKFKTTKKMAQEYMEIYKQYLPE